MSWVKNWFIVLFLLQSSLGYAAVKSNESQQEKQESMDIFEDDDFLDEPDPLEDLNRITFTFNRIIDGIFFKPVATLYENCVNDNIKIGVRNALDNVFSPLEMMNHTLQGEGESAVKSFFRFCINSTFGILGIFDVAKEMGLEKESTSLNETFTRWGVETGPYLVLPILGPSSFRDTYARAGEFYADPWWHVTKNYKRKGNRHGQQRRYVKIAYALDALDKRRQVLGPMDDLERTANDFYVAMRSAYFQRQEQVKKKVERKKNKK